MWFGNALLRTGAVQGLGAPAPPATCAPGAAQSCCGCQQRALPSQPPWSGALPAAHPPLCHPLPRLPPLPLRQSLPYRQRESASRTGVIPAEEDTLSLGLVTFPPCFLDYVEGPGGTWDPAHPAGSPEEAAAKAAAAAAAAAAPPARPAALLALPPADRAARGLESGDVEAALGSQEVATAQASGSGTLSWLSGLASRLAGSKGRSAAGAAGDLREPLLGTSGSLDLRSDSGFSAMCQGAEEGEVTFIPEVVPFASAQRMVGAAPAVPPGSAALGMAWLAEPEAGAQQAFLREPRKQEGPEAAEPVAEERPASRYSSACAARCALRCVPSARFCVAHVAPMLTPTSPTAPHCRQRLHRRRRDASLYGARRAGRLAAAGAVLSADRGLGGAAPLPAAGTGRGPWGAGGGGGGLNGGLTAACHVTPAGLADGPHPALALCTPPTPSTNPAPAVGHSESGHRWRPPRLPGSRRPASPLAGGVCGRQLVVRPGAAALPTHSHAAPVHECARRGGRRGSAA